MTPQEKSEELYSKYYNRIEHSLSEDVSGFEKDIVKHLVVIAVDEILVSFTAMSYGLLYLGQINYWEEVKQEIEKL
jgi:hypothetical protein